MFGLGIYELIVILIILILLFGASRLPELASGIGQALRNFRKATTESDELESSAGKSIERSPNKAKDRPEE